MVRTENWEEESFKHGADWSDRLQQQTFPLKVKNTFISDDHEFNDEVGDAFQRRQLSAPAASAHHHLPTSPFIGTAPDGSLSGMPNLRMSDFILDEFAPPWQDWSGEQAFQDKSRVKRNEGPFPPGGAFGVIEPLRGFGVPVPMPEMDNPPQLLEGGQVPPLMNSYGGTPLPAPPASWADTTTVMMRNLPNKYTQRMLLTEINQTGFLGTFDFLYLPIDPETNANRGYAFLNFVNSAFAWMFKMSYEGRKMNRFNSNKVASVMRATLQGFDANYAHYSTARVSRGDPAARPLFLRESTQTNWHSKPAAKQRSARNKGIRTEQPEMNMMPKQAPMPQPPKVTEDIDVPNMSGDAQKLVPKFCPHCGNSIQPHFQFCPHCGQTISVGGL
jgi:hypothetical protein